MQIDNKISTQEFFRKRKRRLAAIAVAIICAVVAGTLSFWIYFSRFESTDDAFIDGHVLAINSKVAGQVLNVYVDDNKDVKKGDLLVEIDPVDYRLKLGQAHADLEAAQAQNRLDTLNAERSLQLYQKQEVSQQLLDEAKAAVQVSKAKVDSASKRVSAAELDLADTKIYAPESGKITRKNVETRNYIQIGQPLMALVSQEVWVIANFKETQLANMHPGQKVIIRIDAYKDRTFNGHVESVQAGTGARFSLFPPENATGNYVKVVQRVPVKIIFDESPEILRQLSPGMSVNPRIVIKS